MTNLFVRTTANDRVSNAQIKKTLKYFNNKIKKKNETKSHCPSVLRNILPCPAATTRLVLPTQKSKASYGSDVRRSRPGSTWSPRRADTRRARPRIVVAVSVLLSSLLFSMRHNGVWGRRLGSTTGLDNDLPTTSLERDAVIYDRIVSTRAAAADGV